MPTKSEKALINRAIGQMRQAVTEGYRSRFGYIHRDPGEVTYCAVIFKNKHIWHVENQACHAGLNYVGDCERPHGGYIPKFVISRLQFEHNKFHPLPQEVVDSFLKWLTRYSPYREAFVFKGGLAIRKRGFVVTRTDLPTNFIHGAHIASRTLTEHHGQIVRVWHELCKEGVNPNVAYYYAHTVHVNFADVCRVNLSNHNWHVPLNGGYANYSDVIHNFKHRRAVGAMSSDYCENTYAYGEINSLFGDGRGKFTSYTSKAYADVRASEGNKESCNPFKGKDVQQQPTLENFCRELAKYIKGI